MDKLRQSGRVFKYKILAYVRGLPTSQVACGLAKSLVFLSPLHPAPPTQPLVLKVLFTAPGRQPHTSAGLSCQLNY